MDISRPVRWHSDVLGEEILIVPHGTDVGMWHFDHPEADRSAVVYSHEELRALKGTSPEALRLMHETKRVFGEAIILPPEDIEPPKPKPAPAPPPKPERPFVWRIREGKRVRIFTG